MGYYVMGNHTSRSWHSTWAEAEAERQRILMIGAWSGLPPRVQPDDDLKTRWASLSRPRREGNDG